MTFEVGDGRPRGPSVYKLMQKRKAVEEIKPPEDGATPELMAMRHVNLNAAKWDITEPQISARKFKNKDPRAFWTLLNDLEDRHRKQKAEAEKAAVIAAMPKEEAAPAAAPEEIEMDEGTERCIALCERLLEEANK